MKVSSYAIKYKKLALLRVFTYKKMKYDLLTYEDAGECLHELLQEVCKACKWLPQNNFRNGDVRISITVYMEIFAACKICGYS